MSKSIKIKNKREGYAFPNALVLKDHEHSEKGTLWTMDRFELDGKSYALEPGYIQNEDGSIELLEISIVKLEIEEKEDCKHNFEDLDNYEEKKDYLDGGCTCFQNAPCGFCETMLEKCTKCWEIEEV